MLLLFLQFGAYVSTIFYIRRKLGKSPSGLIYAIVCFWLLLSYVVVGSMMYKLSALHDLEPLIAILYYIWASIFLGLEIANEVPRT